MVVAVVLGLGLITMILFFLYGVPYILSLFDNTTEPTPSDPPPTTPTTTHATTDAEYVTTGPGLSASGQSQAPSPPPPPPPVDCSGGTWSQWSDCKASDGTVLTQCGTYGIQNENAAGTHPGGTWWHMR